MGDGVVFGVQKLVLSKLLVAGTNRRVYTVEKNLGIAVAGLSADARQVVNRAREEAQQYKSVYQDIVPAKHLCERLANYMQMFTLYSSVRPFGASAILGALDAKAGPQLFLVEPSGVAYGYYACAVGKGRQAAKTELEKLKLSEMTCREACFEAARIIHMVHDEAKDKAMELELSWVCTESDGKHQLVPDDVKADAEQRAKQAL